MSDLVVRNTTIRSKSHAIKFGSTCDADCYNGYFENITIYDSNSGLSVQQRGTGSIYNLTFRDIRVETRYQSPRWWGNGEWLSFTVEPRYIGDSVGDIHDLRFEGITARSENGGLLSANIPNGVNNVVFSDINVTILSGIGNYSTGLGPACCKPGGDEMTCMGTRDHGPSYVEDVDCTSFGNCRTVAKADGLRIENAHNVLLEDFNVEFEGDRQDWFGGCVALDERCTEVEVKGTKDCVNAE